MPRCPNLACPADVLASVLSVPSVPFHLLSSTFPLSLAHAVPAPTPKSNQIQANSNQKNVRNAAKQEPHTTPCCGEAARSRACRVEAPRSRVNSPSSQPLIVGPGASRFHLRHPITPCHVRPICPIRPISRDSTLIQPPVLLIPPIANQIKAMPAIASLPANKNHQP